MTTLLNSFRKHFENGSSFTESDAERLLDDLIESEDEQMLASVFRAWDRKGIDENEIFLVAKVLRQRCEMISSRHETVIDIVGTGGGRSKTFNVSTAASFVVAGGGIAVAKHGNKAATSNSGSADVLAELGIAHNVLPEVSQSCLNEIGICFMFAPNHHRLSPTLAKVRRGLGFPTIFNCVGPLCNPAGAQHQLIGVWDRSLVPKMANALARLGTEHSWIVHGNDGVDEISVSETTTIAEVCADTVTMSEIGPEELIGRRYPANGAKAPTPKESAAIVRTVLDGTVLGPAAEAIALANATAAIYLANGGKTDFQTAHEIAQESIRSGSARLKLAALADATNR